MENRYSSRCIHGVSLVPRNCGSLYPEPNFFFYFSSFLETEKGTRIASSLFFSFDECRPKPLKLSRQIGSGGWVSWLFKETWNLHASCQEQLWLLFHNLSLLFYTLLLKSRVFFRSFATKQVARRTEKNKSWDVNCQSNLTKIKMIFFLFVFLSLSFLYCRYWECTTENDNLEHVRRVWRFVRMAYNNKGSGVVPSTQLHDNILWERWNWKFRN